MGSERGRVVGPAPTQAWAWLSCQGSVLGTYGSHTADPADGAPLLSPPNHTALPSSTVIPLVFHDRREGLQRRAPASSPYCQASRPLTQRIRGSASPAPRLPLPWPLAGPPVQCTGQSRVTRRPPRATPAPSPVQTQAGPALRGQSHSPSLRADSCTFCPPKVSPRRAPHSTPTQTPLCPSSPTTYLTPSAPSHVPPPTTVLRAPVHLTWPS